MIQSEKGIREEWLLVPSPKKIPTIRKKDVLPICKILSKSPPNVALYLDIIVTMSPFNYKDTTIQPKKVLP